MVETVLHEDVQRTRQRPRRLRMKFAAVVATTSLASTGCVIALPDGAIPGGTNCTLTWLEPFPGVGGPGADPAGEFIASIIALGLYLTPITRCANLGA